VDKVCIYKSAVESDSIRRHVSGQLQSSSAAEKSLSADQSSSLVAARCDTQRAAAAHQLLQFIARSRRQLSLSALHLPRLTGYAVAG